MNDDNALCLRISNVGELLYFVFENNVALVSPESIDPRQNLHERRFAGSVLAANCVNLSAFNRE